MNNHYNYDVHGMSLTRFINAINLFCCCVPESTVDICVIHGYNHGRVLKDYLRNQFKHKRVMSIEEYGNGRTLLKLN